MNNNDKTIIETFRKGIKMYFREDSDIGLMFDNTSDELLKEKIAYLFSCLTHREARVLEVRWGLEDGVRHTLEEVGCYFNVTRERIRQIEAKALRKLRHPMRKEVLLHGELGVCKNCGNTSLFAPNDEEYICLSCLQKKKKEAIEEAEKSKIFNPVEDLDGDFDLSVLESLFDDMSF